MKKTYLTSTHSPNLSSHCIMLPTCSFYQQNFSFNLKISTVLPVNGQLIIPRTLTKYRLSIEIFGRGRKKTPKHVLV